MHVRFLQIKVLRTKIYKVMTEISEEGGIMVEDEFSEEASDQGSLQDTGQARVLVLKPEEILADPLPSADPLEENNSSSEKVIHINTRYF